MVSRRFLFPRYFRRFSSKFVGFPQRISRPIQRHVDRFRNFFENWQHTSFSLLSKKYRRRHFLRNKKAAVYDRSPYLLFFLIADSNAPLVLAFQTSLRRSPGLRIDTASLLPGSSQWIIIAILKSRSSLTVAGPRRTLTCFPLSRPSGRNVKSDVISSPS